MPKIRKKTSKRVGLREKYTVQKKVASHHKKIKKQAKKLGQFGIKPRKTKKGNIIPNSVPNKEEILNQMEAEYQTLKDMREAKRLEEKNGVYQFNQQVNAQVNKVPEDLDKKKYGGLTKEEFEEAEKLIDPEGV